ncbi:MAG: hypothetical protein ACFB5Z_15430 [Elainellaceae cyanobacterium]
MTTQNQARALMVRHHHMIKNRQRAMLGRSLAEAGMPAETVAHVNSIQGKPYSAAQASYDRSPVAMS